MTDTEPLTEPPDEPEGDDIEAGGGEPVTPVSEDDLADVDPLDDDDDSDPADDDPDAFPPA